MSAKKEIEIIVGALDALYWAINDLASSMDNIPSEYPLINPSVYTQMDTVRDATAALTELAKNHSEKDSE